MAADDSVSLLEFSVEEYKSLQAIRFDWSARTVVYGRNGAGKTNLLEAIALCFGSAATLWQIADRAVAPPPGSLSAVLRSTPAELPLAPSWCGKAIGSSGPPQPDNLIAASAAFWSMLGADEHSGSTWATAMEQLIAHDELADLLIAAASRPTVRYRLQRIDGLEEAKGVDRGAWMRDEFTDDPARVSFARRFARTLVVEAPVPDWLRAVAPRLPIAFAPLRRWLDQPEESRGPWADVLELSAAPWAPVRAVWLASERNASEAWFDLDNAYERAVEPVIHFGHQVDRLKFATDSNGNEERHDHPDAEYWLVAAAADAVNDTVKMVFAGLDASAEDRYTASLSVSRNDGARWQGVGRVSDPDLYQRLSSGERSWLDIGFAHAASRLEDLAVAVYWVTAGIAKLPDMSLLEAAMELEATLDVFREGYWATSDLDAVLAYMRRLLGSAIEVLTGIPEDDESRSAVQQIFASATNSTVRDALRPALRLHLYDEPERHLHPDAQRRIQRALSSPEETDVMLATHSHLFLGGANWTHLHLGASPEGPVLTPFIPAELDVASAVTRQLGLSRGELLSRIRYVLFVEGPVDVLVLRTLYGDLFDDAGVLLLPIHGVDESASLAELELFGRLVDVGAGLLVDHARSTWLDARRAGPGATKEESAVRDLRRRLKSRGRVLDFYGLEREDIIAYLADDAVRAELPQFPGWHSVMKQRQRGEKLKDAAARMSGTDHLGRRIIERIALHMAADGLPAGGDLPERIADVVSASDRSDGQSPPGR